VFGIPMRSGVPAHSSAFARNWIELSATMDEPKSMPDDLNRRNLATLNVGQNVWIQDLSDKRWKTFGQVVKAQGRNYIVKLPSGNTLWRNRRHLRPYIAGDETHMGDHHVDPGAGNKVSQHKKSVSFSDETNADDTPGPRRSTRKRRKPDRFKPGNK
jgi:hypothetical protein